MDEKDSNSTHGKKPWPQYRSKHRQRSHEQAHADQFSTDDTPDFSHTLVCDQLPQIITDSNELTDFIEHVRTVGSFGYDSEFIGEHSYYPQLCVLQVATPERIAIIDPLQGLDLTPFWQLVADPKVETIVHAGQPDLEPVVRHLDQSPRHIFDTQIAAAFAGCPYPMALAKLLQALTDRDLMRSSRGLKFSQWDRRPLTEAQLRYAAEDVRYLPLARHELMERLTSAGTQQFALLECQSLSEKQLYRFNPDNQRVRVRGYDKLKPHERNIVRALLAWRETAAQRHNAPPRALLRDEVLVELATSEVRSAEDLGRISGLPRPLEREYGSTLVDLVRQARTLAIDDEGDEDWSKSASSKQERDQRRDRVLQLWNVISDFCQLRQIAPAIVTSKRELNRVLRAFDAGENPATSCRILQGWRRELLGSVLSNHLQRQI